MSEWLGKMLGKVRIDSLLARGGIAEVYLGEHVALQREVAVKILRNQYEDDPDLLERFQREARVVAKLRHSNIVQVFDFDSTTDNRPYLVMEYVPGISLSRYLHVLHGKNGRLELPIIGRIITQTAHALQYAHESGVIHRDVKPGNILLTSRTEKVMAGKPLPGDFEPILTDFGLVRFLNSSRQTTTGVIAGTPAYMSPEQARGEPTDERTDIYSLGIVLYELLAGHIPFDGETTMSIILKHVTEPPPPIAGIPFELQSVLDRALAKKPEDRFPTANDLARAFEASIQETGNYDTLRMEASPKETTHITTIGYKEKPKPRNKWLPVALTSIVVVILSGFLYFKGAPQSSTPTATQPIPTQSLAVTVTEVTPTPVPLPPGVIHFQDGAAFLDQASLKALSMTAPPEGSHYEVWFFSGREWKSLGILLLNADGSGDLISKDAAGSNLLSLYDQAYVTIELNSDLDANPSNLIAYSSVLPSEGLTHLRNLLVSSSETPNSVALIQGLNTDVELISQTIRAMQSAYQKGNETSTSQNAEAVLNLMAGAQGEDHQDWNGDGQMAEAGDGVGLFPNGETLGYIQSISSHADSAVNSLNATQPMIKHGEEVKVCAQNLDEWTSQLQGLLIIIVASPPGTDLSQPVLDSVTLADQMLNGVDTDNDKSIDAVTGECGMSSLYGYAYSMADMPLTTFDTNTIIATATDTTTPTPTITPTRGGNSTGPGGGGSTSVPNPPTKKPPPGGGKPPTKTPNH